MAVSTPRTCHGKIISRRKAGPWHIRSSESGRALVGQSGLEDDPGRGAARKGGAIPAPGSVERGTTVCDYTPLEKQLQHSLKLALASFEYQEHRIHLLDTPGYPDFLGQALPAFAAVETAAIVINAQNGIEMMTGGCSPGRQARPRSADRHQQDRRRERRSGAAARPDPAGVRQGMPAAQPAGANRSKVSDCFFAPSGDRLLLGGGSAPQARRPGGRGRREADGEVPGKGRGEPRRAARAARARAARRPPHSGRVHIGEDRRRNRRAARCDRALLPNPTEGNPPSSSPRRATARAPICSRTRASTRSRTSSRSRSILHRPMAVFRVHQVASRPAASSTSAKGENRSRPDICTCCAARRRSKCTRPFLATSAPSRKSTTSSSTISCTTPPKTRTCTPSRLPADAGIRSRRAAEEARRRAESVRCPAQDPRRGSLLPDRAQLAGERDGDARPGRDAPQDRTREDVIAVQARPRHARPSIPYRETIAARAEGTAGTRRPAAPASSAKCS